MTVSQLQRDNLLWDPAIRYHQGSWYQMVLAVPRTALQADVPFWKLARRYVVRRWNELNQQWDVVATVGGPGRERLCAGSIVFDHDNNLLVFGSSIYHDVDNFHLGQHIWMKRLKRHAASWIDILDSWSLKPDPAYFQTQRYDRAGRPLYACRDPYHYREPDDRHRLFCVSGGARWGVEPSVVVASSDHLEGPYRWNWKATVDMNWNGEPALYELERVSVFRHDGTLWMTGHCWSGWYSDAFKRYMTGMGIRLTDSTMVLFRQSREQFRLCETIPVVLGSSESGLYGTQLVEHNGSLTGWGWRFRDHSVEPGCGFTLDPDTMTMILDKDPDDDQKDKTGPEVATFSPT